MKVSLVLCFIAVSCLVSVAQAWVVACYIKVAAQNIGSLRDVGCVSGVLIAGQQQVSKANCIGCDKYFHCKAFKKATKTCGSDAKRIALAFGNCRAADEHDPEDRVANNFGANGGNCESRYLHICNYGNNCKWNPTVSTCSQNNVYNPSNHICNGLPN